MATEFQNVSNHLLDLDKDCNNVIIALTPIHDKWNQLAAHLNIPVGTIDSIATKYNNADHFKQMSDMISTWISRPTKEHYPSKRVLCQALAAMGEIALANKIAGIKDDQQPDGLKTKQPVSVLQDKKLCDAAKNGYIELIETLIKSGANVNTKDENNLWTIPIQEASSNGHCEAVNLLISLGAEVNKKSHFVSRTPLHDASERGHSDIVNTLISHGAIINEKDKWGVTPLHEASIEGHCDIVNTLISHGAIVNEKNTIMGNTPLHLASHGHSDTVNTLISHGATINEKNNVGYTPLHWASSEGHSDTVSTLISHGAIVNEKDYGGNTPLHGASEYNHSDTVNVLLSNGAIVNSVDKNHQTPLHRCLIWSRSNNITATAELLISHGADLYQEDKNGNSPVLIATVLGYKDLLLSHGISEDTISKYRLPEGWKAASTDGRIEYTNTMTGVTQFKHPSL